MLRWLLSGERCEARVVLRRGGPLVAEYRSLAPCHVVDNPVVRTLDRVSAGIGSVRGTPNAELGLIHGAGLWPRLRSQAATDVVVANTLAALELATSLVTPGAALVCHVHELDHVAQRVLANSRRRTLLDSVDRFIATGPAVAAMLIDRWGVNPSRVYPVDAFIEEPKPSRESVGRARHVLTGGSMRPVVLSVGAMRRRKGPEEFVDLMGMLAELPTKPRGVWLGGDPQSSERQETEGDIRRAGLQGDVRVMESVADASPYIAASDVVVSVAREDPFPLVALEAGALGVPVIGFDAGGLGHILGSAGSPDMAVPLGDLYRMTDRLGLLLSDEEYRRQQGESLQSWVLGTHLVDHVAPVLWQAIIGDR
ncbi:MAG: glycosyltransferase family 4 protein [Microthrixaceae bacterium]